jgi:predicted MPP superfamily phosphohydrolase
VRRRDLLRAGAVAVGAAAVGLGLDAFLIEPQHVELVRQPMPLEGLPDALVGRTLLQLSDLHVGHEVSSSFLRRCFMQARALAPDYVAFTGDFITLRDGGELAELARVLRDFPHGRLGTVASLGNHDYGRGWREMGVAAQVTRIASDAGLHVLRNEVVTLGGLQFAGLADFWSPAFGPAGGAQPAGLLSPAGTRQGDASGDARSAIAAIRPLQPTVILSHNPDVQDEPLWDGIRGWVLAGHTHGGQVKPPFLPPPVLPVRNRRYTAGRFDVGPGRTMYVNRALGHLHHVRFNVRPEITLFTLARA